MKTPWTREEALEMISEISPGLKSVGYELALAGSILTKGTSSKDVDVVLFPTNSNQQDLPKLKEQLETLGMRLLHTEEIVKARWKRVYNSEDKKHVEVWEWKGKRVDLFFLK